jgi:hypothetical protein
VLIYYNLGFNFLESWKILPCHIEKRDLMLTARHLLERELNTDFLQICCCLHGIKTYLALNSLQRI